MLLSACAAPPAEPMLAPVRRATPTADVLVFVLYPTTPTPQPVPGDGAEGLRETLTNFRLPPGGDLDGAKTEALATLFDFADPQGPYGGAWWFADDGRADIFEALAVILYTEGHTSTEVRRAVAARYLWYCGGARTACGDMALVNFLSYFQPWREPQAVRGGFTHPAAQVYLAFAKELVYQQPGLLTEWIPGADQFVHDPDGISVAGPVAWAVTPFHFANVHPTWDAYLRKTLGRAGNGPALLWVLTMGEAARVCPSSFVCPDMTQERSN